MEIRAREVNEIILMLALDLDRVKSSSEKSTARTIGDVAICWLLAG